VCIIPHGGDYESAFTIGQKKGEILRKSVELSKNNFQILPFAQERMFVNVEYAQ
jgi:hypothetical protein